VKVLIKNTTVLLSNIRTPLFFCLCVPHSPEFKVDPANLANASADHANWKHSVFEGSEQFLNNLLELFVVNVHCKVSLISNPQAIRTHLCKGAELTQGALGIALSRLPVILIHIITKHADGAVEKRQALRAG
jgi:hypothetical protein